MKSKEEIEQLAEQYIKDNTGDHYVYCGFVDGYTQCQQDMDKKYTEEDIRKTFMAGIECAVANGKNFEQYINSLNKQD